MAKAYLSAKSPELLTRTWADVMEHYSVTGAGGATVATLPLDFYEAQKQKNVVQFTAAA